MEDSASCGLLCLSFLGGFFISSSSSFDGVGEDTGGAGLKMLSLADEKGSKADGRQVALKSVEFQVFDQYVSELASGSAVPLPLPQWRNQHGQGQRKLAPCSPNATGERSFRFRRKEIDADYP